MTDWDHHQEFERAWWGDCANTYNEETKQLLYAERMGLWAEQRDGKQPVYDLAGATVLDIGGGPSSILLKCVNRGKGCAVLDPCAYPGWVRQRYASTGIMLLESPAERLDYGEEWGDDPASKAVFDEVWIYNVLQHTQNPAAILRGACKHGRLLRIFEWIDIPAHEGHPHELSKEFFLTQLGMFDGRIAALKDSLWWKTETFDGDHSCYGKAFYGQYLVPGK